MMKVEHSPRRVSLQPREGNCPLVPEELEANDVEVLGVTEHGAFRSIYFFDPNGHRLELACPDPDEEAMNRKLDSVEWEMLEEWSRAKRAPKHAAFLHRREFS